MKKNEVVTPKKNASIAGERARESRFFGGENAWTLGGEALLGGR